MSSDNQDLLTHLRNEAAAREAASEAARAVYFEADRAAAMAAFEYGSARYREGWQKGWVACLDAIRRATAASATPPEPPDPPQPKIPGLLAPVRHEVLAGGETAADVVYKAVTDKPGMRGVEIVQFLQRQGSPLLERTVRTALHRLKEAQRIRVLDGKWYSPDSAPPADPVDLMKGQSDAAP